MSAITRRRPSAATRPAMSRFVSASVAAALLFATACAGPSPAPAASPPEDEELTALENTLKTAQALTTDNQPDAFRQIDDLVMDAAHPELTGRIAALLRGFYEKAQPPTAGQSDRKPVLEDVLKMRDTVVALEKWEATAKDRAAKRQKVLDDRKARDEAEKKADEDQAARDRDAKARAAPAAGGDATPPQGETPEQKAAREKAAREKAEAEQKAAREKAEAEQKAAQEKAARRAEREKTEREADRKAAEDDKKARIEHDALTGHLYELVTKVFLERGLNESVKDYIKLSRFLDEKVKTCFKGDELRLTSLQSTFTLLKQRYDLDLSSKPNQRYVYPTAEPNPITVRNNSKNGERLTVLVHGELVNIPAGAERRFRFAGFVLYPHYTDGSVEWAERPVEKPGVLTFRYRASQGVRFWDVQLGDLTDPKAAANAGASLDRAGVRALALATLASAARSASPSRPGPAILRSWLEFTTATLMEDPAKNKDIAERLRLDLEKPPAGFNAAIEKGLIDKNEWKGNVTSFLSNDDLRDVYRYYGSRGEAVEVDPKKFHSVRDLLRDCTQLANLCIMSSTNSSAADRQAGIEEFQLLSDFWDRTNGLVDALRPKAKLSAEEDERARKMINDYRSVIVSANHQRMVVQKNMDDEILNARRAATPAVGSTPSTIDIGTIDRTLEDKLKKAKDAASSRLEEVTRARTQFYSAWVEHPSKVCYVSLLRYHPDGSDGELRSLCVYYPRYDPAHVYYFARLFPAPRPEDGPKDWTGSGQFWARLDIRTNLSANPFDQTSWQWTPNEKRPVVELTADPSGLDFRSASSLPEVPFTASTRQQLLWPSLAGLPIGGAGRSSYSSEIGLPAPPDSVVEDPTPAPPPPAPAGVLPAPPAGVSP